MSEFFGPNSGEFGVVNPMGSLESERNHQLNEPSNQKNKAPMKFKVPSPWVEHFKWTCSIFCLLIKVSWLKTRHSWTNNLATPSISGISGHPHLQMLDLSAWCSTTNPHPPCCDHLPVISIGENIITHLLITKHRTAQL